LGEGKQGATGLVLPRVNWLGRLLLSALSPFLIEGRGMLRDISGFRAHLAHGLLIFLRPLLPSHPTVLLGDCRGPSSNDILTFSRGSRVAFCGWLGFFSAGILDLPRAISSTPIPAAGLDLSCNFGIMCHCNQWHLLCLSCCRC